jgi:hypothetical protein
MDEGAAFGFFPQLRPRRRLQDPTASADVPLQVLRGRLAGLLGLPSDIGNIVRSPMPMEMFGDYEYEKPPQLPYTTEQFLKELPLAPTAPVGQLAGQAASFVPLNPAPLVRGAQKLGTMVGEGMAERVATGRPMLPSLLAEPQAAMFAVEPNVPRMNLLDTPPETMTSLLEVKPQAVVSDLGFYSAAEQAALNLQRNKGSGQAFLNDLLKAENVKKDELQWMGVDDFLKEKPNVTKQEVQDFIANNRVDVQEIKLSGKSDSTRPFVEWSPSEQNYLVYADDEIPLGTFNTSREAEKYISDNFGKPTQYDQYQLPGGENYREILMTLPNQWDKPRAAQVANEARIKELRQEMYGTSGTDEIRSEISRLRNENTDLQKQINDAPIYKSSHFNEPNILAHIRVNDRVDADGKKMLLIEEIQSDWHQAGREKGYKGQFKDLPNDYKVESKTDKDGYTYYEVLDPQGNVFAKDYSKGSVTNQAINRLNETVGGVPDAPFKDTWYQLALKRVLKHAADNGYERVGLTTGKQQAERFDLSQQIGQINARPTPDGKIALEAMTPDMRSQVFNKVVNADELNGIVGKEIAEKIKNQIEYPKSFDDRGKSVELSGLDLTVGGEGMKKYYDEIYPKFLDKYGKKWNARVGETQITTDYARDANGIPAQRPSKESIRYIDITPEMKGAVSKGQPLFAATPALPLGGLLGEPEKKKELSLLD